MTAPASRTGRTRSDAPLTAAWLVTALAVGVVGWLLFALSESAEDRAVRGVFCVAAVLAAGLGLALLTRVGGGRRWSQSLSGVMVLLGIGGAAVLLGDEVVFASDVLLVALPPVVGGVLTAISARRRR